MPTLYAVLRLAVLCCGGMSGVDVQVVFKQTEYNNLAVGLFQSRAEMHRRVYTHT
jgi:hypothetical protein